ncbi:hypothetical protein [Comamonas sp. 4034]|uniref:hypothetical protein n=1 Tax=Comamonas sp. 4034 TaxID=3156455 RepID=UPI003D1B5BA6
MKPDQIRSQTQALVQAIFDVRPAVLRIDGPKSGLSSLTLTVEMSPDLIQAWAEKCKEIRPAPNPSPMDDLSMGRGKP